MPSNTMPEEFCTPSIAEEIHEHIYPSEDIEQMRRNINDRPDAFWDGSAVHVAAAYGVTREEVKRAWATGISYSDWKKAQNMQQRENGVVFVPLSERHLEAIEGARIVEREGQLIFESLPDSDRESIVEEIVRLFHSAQEKNAVPEVDPSSVGALFEQIFASLDQGNDYLRLIFDDNGWSILYRKGHLTRMETGHFRHNKKSMREKLALLLHKITE